MRRVIVAGVTAGAALLFVAVPAAAHNEWEPNTAAPGSVVDLTLFVEDEQPDAGTTTVELFFPAPLTVAALPAVPGWTATPMDGELGGPASGVTWAGGPAPADLELPIRLGPLPSEPAPEPPAPGPVLDLIPGGPGSIPATTVASTTTTASTTSTTAAPTTTESEQAAAEDTDDGSDSNVVLIAVAAAVVVAVAGGVFAFVRSRRSPHP
jgi:uncharacterized protein YcnI